MSKWDKLIQKILNLNKDLQFSEVQKVLESYGYKMRVPRGGSSHVSFWKENKETITIPKHEPIKIAYIKLVKNAIEQEEQDR